MRVGVALLSVLAAGACPLWADPCELEEPGFVCPVAGTGEVGFNDDGLPPDETDFFLISRARRGPDGLLYFMDFNNWRVRRLEPEGVIETVAGNGFHASAVEGLAPLESPLDNPTDFVFLPDGRLTMVSFEDPRVIAIEDNELRVLAGRDFPGTVGNEGDGGVASLAEFMELMGIAVDDDGVVYLADARANRVRKIEDGRIDTVAGNGIADFTGDGGAANEATLSYPSALAVGPDRALYIADTRNHVVRRVGPDGTITTIAGTGEPGLSGDDGPATEAQLNEPNGIEVRDDGTVYISDRANFRVRQVSPDGTLTTLAGTEEGNSGDGERATEARFGYLARITLDGDSLLIADQSNSVVRRVYLP